MWKVYQAVGLCQKKYKGFQTVELSWKIYKGLRTMAPMDLTRNERSKPLKNKIEILMHKNERLMYKNVSLLDLEKVKFTDDNVDFPTDGISFNCQTALAKISPTYPLGMKNCVEIVKGKRLDVVSLLSNGGKRDYLVRNNGEKVAVESITGKYLLICCFKVPLYTMCVASRTCRSMIAAYSHLLEKHNNFEMVMVAKMVRAGGDDDDEAVFNHFFSGFPCPAIPFWDTESREFVCKSLGLINDEEHCAAIVVDPDHMVLQTAAGDCFLDYGASGFPYTDDRLAALAREDDEMKHMLFDFEVVGGQLIKSPRPVSLVELLGGSDVFLSRFGGDKISVSDLSKKKCVVLYIYNSGGFLHQLIQFDDSCLRNNLEFEVVWIPMPFCSATMDLNYSRFGLKNWLRFSFCDNVEAACRLWRISSNRDYLGDKAIIVADSGDSVRIEQEFEFLEDVESTFSYPYTRKSMFDKMFCYLRSITLDSLLRVDLISSDPEPTRRLVPVSELKGRNVLLYVDFYRNISKRHGVYKLMLQFYKKMKEHDPNSQVVFVPLGDEAPATAPVMPWLALPHSAAQIQHQRIYYMFHGGMEGAELIAFGKDGLMHSPFILPRFQEYEYDGVSLFDDIDKVLQELFDDKLSQELFDYVDSYLE